jgi:hypothetical protein
MISQSNPDKPLPESAKRSIVVDMSPAAIDRRMRELAALWDFWKCLRKIPARPTGSRFRKRRPAFFSRFHVAFFFLAMIWMRR